MQKNFSINKKTGDLCHIAVFAAIIAVCAQISVPMPFAFGVPFTLQTFAIPLAGVVLGTKKGTAATVVYVLIGIAGVPIFSGFTGGMSAIFGKTGGFILSFPLLALAGGIGAECKIVLSKSKTKAKPRIRMMWMALWLITGIAFNFFCGMLMFSFVTSNSLATSFGYVVAPFIPTAIVKVAMVMGIGRPINSALLKAGVLRNCQ